MAAIGVCAGGETLLLEVMRRDEEDNHRDLAYRRDEPGRLEAGHMTQYARLVPWHIEIEIVECLTIIYALLTT